MKFEKEDLIILVLGLLLVMVAFLLAGNREVAAAGLPQGERQDRNRLVAQHQNTSFPLLGKHTQVECKSCHINGMLSGTPETCETCHWARRQDDPYRLQLGTQCGDCHTPQDWSRIQTGVWQHENVTGFHLEGMHAALDCTECHSSRSFGETTAECSQCHTQDFQRAKEPDHLAANFPTDCQLCHFNESTWRGARFEHSFFPLSGQHNLVSCENCHVNGRFAGTPTQCIDCHRTDFDTTQDPNHLEAGFSTDCASCHGSSSATWRGAQFDHDLVFPLRGNHKALECTECHVSGVFAGTSSACVDCHRVDYDQTRNPNHLQAGFPTDCVACHGASATSWQTASFDHDSVFPLKGMHKTADCVECHVNGNFTATASDCIDCHRADFNATANPNHMEAGFSTNCVACHGDGATTWSGANFNHDRIFPLRGQHRAADCTQCHVGGRFAGTSSNCVACHRAEYDATRSPQHTTAGFGTDCESCHGEGANSWTGATFNHDTVFPLVGKHRAVDCTQCHVGGRFSGTPTDCIGCHRSDYERTTSPNHASAGFGTNCASCHGTASTTWLGASFDHDRFFPLLGKHKAADCQLCHVGGRYAGTPSNCIDCHRSDYDRTTIPNHAAAGFDTNCENCHGNNATTWLGATFDHNAFFPLQGAHRPLDCNACHAAGYNLPRNCFGCHSADYTATRSPNHASAGFPTTCESCHFPTHVRWNQATFNHDFPIDNGPHKKFDCTECHKTSNYFQFSCIDCHEHRKSKMDDKHKDEGGYTYSSPACYSCHPNGKS